MNKFYPEIIYLKIVVFIFSLIVIISCIRNPASENDTSKYNWDESTYTEQNIDITKIKEAVEVIASEEHIYSFLLIRNNTLVTEEYFHGYNSNSSFNVRSVSKSFLSALTGVALQEGYLDSVGQKALDFFPEYTNENIDARKYQITIENLLTMKAGVSSDTYVYFDVYQSNDWIQATLNLPQIADPGVTFSYNTFLTHMLSAILTKSTQMNSKAFAESYLTNPLRIELTNWEQGPQGYYFGGNSMYFRTRDMAALGILYLNNGYLNDMQIVPSQWIEKSLNDYRQTSNLSWGRLQNIGYGYLWWLGTINNYNTFLALGFGGQFVLCLPQLNVVIAVNSNAYFYDWGDADINERRILEIISDYILPAIH